jgi:hypothetical protein
MQIKILKTTLTGTKGVNLQPAICENLPQGVDAVVLEYGENYAIVKLAWSIHPLAKNPDDKAVKQLLKHPSILEELATHPESEKCIMTHSIHTSRVKEQPDKTILHEGKKGSFIRKIQGKHGEEYVIDEG